MFLANNFGKQSAQFDFLLGQYCRLAAFELLQQAIHACYRAFHGADHVVHELRVVLVFPGIGHQQGLLCNEVFQVMHDKRRHAVERFELTRHRKGFRGLHLGQVGSGLARGGLDQIADFPVEWNLSQ